jgi:protein-disulfide isomerase
MQKTNWLLALIITALTSIVSAAYEDKEASENKASQNIEQSFYKVSPYDIVYGNDNASIEVLEYFSLTCSHCSYFYLSIFPELKKKYIDTGKVKWIKRLYVGDRAAMDGSLLLNCVDKSMRKKYLNILLSKQSNWAFQQDPGAVLSNIASLGGISNKKFQDCMDDKKSGQGIKALTIKAVENAKIMGTPTFYINKEKLNIFSDQAFKERFKEILSNKK